jgi:hydrogenase nickel incorporation protein HypA/HybF
MHELSLCQSIYGIVERVSTGRAVEAVDLTIGQLRQVVPDTLAQCWIMVTDGTSLAGSRLRIEHIPVVLDCRDCGRRTELAEVLALACAECGSSNATVSAGEEFMVTSLELADGDGPRGDEPGGHERGGAHG